MDSKKKNIIVYIDGSNFYFSIKKTFNCKIDIEKFCKKLVENNELVKINYYISPIVQSSNPKMYAEQQSFFEKLKKIDKLNIIFGRLEKHKKDGKIIYVEKATDINLARDLIFDSIDNKYDKALLISNDGDFSGVVSSIINRLDKEIVYVAIGNKKSISYHLKRVASLTLNIKDNFIKDVIIN
ncbi:NYN domain-containing protein [archaeon]|jgi:uncharacterized LabA/DUF88 family protein|nr:NYN domain-containing protein [archaeon]